MQAVVIPPAIHETAGEFIHDDDLAVLHHVVDVPLHEAPGPDGLVDVVGEGGVLRVGEIFHVEGLLCLGNAPGGEGDGPGLFIDHVVGVDVVGLLFLVVHGGLHQALQTGGKIVRQGVQLGGLFPHTGDDQGGTGLVDEDGVHLVHNGESVAPLHELSLVDGHVVPQVIEAKLVVGAVGDVRVVGGFLAHRVHAVDHQAHGEAQKAVNFSHPVAVALGQVVVDGDDVDPFPGQGVEVGGEGGHQGLALAGLHLGDAALVENDAADELHPVGAKPQNPVRGLPAGGKGLGEKIVQGLPLLIPLLEFCGLGLELGVGEPLVLLFQGLDFADNGINALDLLCHVGAEQFGQKTHSG